MPSNHRYNPRVPSVDQTVSNGVAPAGWKFLRFENGEPQKPRTEVPTLEGMFTAVGVPAMVYRPVYLTLAAVSTALPTEDYEVQFQMGDYYVDNVMLVGYSLNIGDLPGGNGVKQAQLTQELVALGQRIAYA